MKRLTFTRIIFLFKHFQKLITSNLNTLRFNYHYFPLKVALRLPVVISSNVVLSSLRGKVVLVGRVYYGKVKIGYGDVGIFDKKLSRSILQISGSIKFEGNASIGHGSKISVGKDAQLTIGNNFVVSAETSIIALKNIFIGNDCLISWECVIMDTDFHKIKDINNSIINPPASVVIGDKVWIGARCLVLKGTQIPSFSVIAAGSTVIGKLSGENCLFAGSPAKVVKSEVEWEI